MEINGFLEELKKLKLEIEKNVAKIENNAKAGIQGTTEVLEKVQKVLPDWFYFIEETGIGDEQEILSVLSEVVNGVNTRDGVFLADALLFGLRELVEGYEMVIEDALHGE